MQRVDGNKNLWCAMEKNTRLTLEFEEGKFHKSYSFYINKEACDSKPVEIASAINRLTEWLLLYHSELM
ncbi:hypothetical protein [Ornithobacterium rhinotracheale]|uniref:hypothetical protein n=1 Tax=Ornithobacterium rhinotracheale TaxID=28251 RepID=UPI0040361C9D